MDRPWVVWKQYQAGCVPEWLGWYCFGEVSLVEVTKACCVRQVVLAAAESMGDVPGVDEQDWLRMLTHGYVDPGVDRLGVADYSAWFCPAEDMVGRPGDVLKQMGAQVGLRRWPVSAGGVDFARRFAWGRAGMGLPWLAIPGVDRDTATSLLHQRRYDELAQVLGWPLGYAYWGDES